MLSRSRTRVEHARRRAGRDGVVDEREEEVLLDVPSVCRLIRRASRSRRSPRTSVTRRFHGESVPVPIGCRRRLRSRARLEAVAGHRDDPPFALQALHDGGSRRAALGITSRAERARDDLGGRSVVAREHHDAHALVAERRSASGRLLDGVGDASRRRPGRDGHEDDVETSVETTVSPSSKGASALCETSTPSSARKRGAQDDGVAFDRPLTPFPADRLEVGRRRRREPTASAPSTMARASGCSLARSRAAAKRSSRSRSCRRAD